MVLDSGAEVFVDRAVNAAGVSFCERAEHARASECEEQELKCFMVVSHVPEGVLAGGTETGTVDDS